MCRLPQIGATKLKAHNCKRCFCILKISLHSNKGAPILHQYVLHDNAPEHKKQQHSVPELKWKNSSELHRDLNPTEHLWEELEH